MAPDKPGFLEELKRRHVWRVAVAYAVAAWVLVQIATQVFPFFNIPNVDVRLVIVLLAIGFPVAVVLAWIYEVTPEGIRRTAPSDALEARSQQVHRDIGRKLNAIIVAVLVLAVALMGWRLLVVGNGEARSGSGPDVAAATPVRPAAAAPASTTTSKAPTLRATSFNPPADTLVVLPFANLSGDKSQQYFSDGITEELTNALGQNTGLRVIAWDTASHYRDTAQPATAIGEALNVANVLTGKILREGNEIRVIVELVNARTGFQVWSDQYDDALANVFQVQDKISAAIADALKVKFASLGPAPTVNPQAHDLVLQANALMDKAHSAGPFEQARKLFEQAIALDPGYADAHAGLGATWFDLTQYSTLPLKDAFSKDREELHKALALDPHNTRALLGLAIADQSEGKLAAARAGYERVLAIDPSYANAHLNYALVLPLQQEQAQTLEAAQLDPDNATAQNNLATTELDLGEYTQALGAAQALMRLDPHSADSAMGLALVNSLLHRGTDAVKAFDLAQPNTELAKALVAAGRLTYQSRLDPKLHVQALDAVEALRRRPDLDPSSTGDLLQLELALGQDATALEQLSKFCADFRVACNDLSVYPEWRPLRGQPTFDTLVRQYDTVSKSTAPASAATTP